ncbi:hypothetical protein FGL95_10270 [Nocardiaceae bacterium YC2-7]|uniref:Beta-N-acetylhexosaminidase n=1 Tax=Antrihabitans stalactiti TaxID=2584121 RepID=A0A848KE41_9NOCA|nr:hypothetical protein [Antrihabitans stalactiti]
MVRRGVVRLLTVLLVVVGAHATQDNRVDAETPTPPVIPALQQWVPGGAEFTLGPTPRIVYSDGALEATSVRLAQGLRAATGRVVATTVGGVARTGDIEIVLGADEWSVPRAESYTATIGVTLVLRAATPAGAQHAAQTALQLLRQSTSVAGGTAVDWPTYRERGLLLDLGRKYLSVAFIEAQIRRMAYLKMNFLQLHLSDYFGFRLQSDVHPEITSPEHYSKHEIRHLIAYAASYNIEVVGDIDFPGHMHAILAAHPELKAAPIGGVPQDGTIDLTNPRSYDLMRDILEEFLPLFPGKYWNVGGDEYGPSASADMLHKFINWADDIVRAHGKTTRIWNDSMARDGSTVPINDGIIVEVWTGGSIPPQLGNGLRPAELIAAGHTIKNSSFHPTYRTSGALALVVNVPPVLTYATWDPSMFVTGDRLSPQDNAHNLGANVNVWFDDPTAETEQQVGAGIGELLRVMAQKTWGSPELPYEEFVRFGAEYGEPVP